MAQPKFSTLVSNLATAEVNATAAGADTRQKSAEKSRLAVEVIKSAYSEGRTGSEVKEALEDVGILKGTVSKIVTVLTALYEGMFDISDLVSLSGAYSAIKPSKKQQAAASGTVKVETVEKIVEVPAVVTIKDVIPTILEHINAAKDPYKEAGVWMTKITQAITDETAKITALEDQKGQ